MSPISDYARWEQVFVNDRDPNNCWKSTAQLAKETGLDVQQVRRMRRWLRQENNLHRMLCLHSINNFLFYDQKLQGAAVEILGHTGAHSMTAFARDLCEKMDRFGGPDDFASAFPSFWMRQSESWKRKLCVAVVVAVAVVAALVSIGLLYSQPRDFSFTDLGWLAVIPDTFESFRSWAGNRIPNSSSQGFETKVLETKQMIYNLVLLGRGCKDALYWLLWVASFPLSWLKGKVSLSYWLGVFAPIAFMISLLIRFSWFRFCGICRSMANVLGICLLFLAIASCIF